MHNHQIQKGCSVVKELWRTDYTLEKEAINQITQRNFGEEKGSGSSPPQANMEETA